MKSIIYNLIMILILTCAVDASAQEDSTYTYEYDCLDCGNFETYSLSPIDLSTNSTVSTEILADTSTTTLAEFSFTSTRIKNLNELPILKKENLIFNIYPNPTIDEFYLNFEVENDVIAEVLFFDMNGQKIFSKEYQLNTGMNVFKNSISNLVSGLYLIRYRTNNHFDSKRLLISK